MLTYEDVVQLFPNKKRFIDPSIHFHTVSAYARYSQAKGIFIPLYHDSGELQEAIANGAIGTLWEYDKALPDYMPNHFFVFYANDLWKGLKNMIEKYQEIVMSNDKGNYTQFLLENESNLNNITQPSDLSSLIKKVDKMKMEYNNGGRD